MRDDLVRRAQAGDHDAFAALVGAALARLFGTARLILRDDDRARDAVRDALVLAWRDLRGLRDPGRFEIWLLRILVGRCKASKTHQQRHGVTEIDVRPLGGSSAAAATDGRGGDDGIERAFRRLSHDQRTILVLVHFACLPVADTAIALDIPVGMARSRLHHASEALRSAMAADDGMTELWDGQIA